MSDTILKIKGLNKTLGKKQILHSIDMECYGGEVYGFLGPNGAGKTTTIKIAVGLLQLDEGEISVDVVQVGARNMQNFTLLKALGRSDKPVLLKRGLSSTLQELLMSAEYLAG